MKNEAAPEGGFQTSLYVEVAAGRVVTRPHSRRMKRSMPRPGDAGDTKERGRGLGRARVRNTSVWLG